VLPVEPAVPEVMVHERTSVRLSAPGWCRPSQLLVASVAGRSASAAVVPAVLAVPVAVLAVPAVVVLELVGGRCSVVALQAVAAARHRRS